MFGVVRQKQESIIHMKRNWILEQLVVTLLVTQRNPKGFDFTVLTIVLELLKPVMLSSLKMAKSVGVRNHEIW